MKITVLGSGGWGTALALLLTDNGHDVTLWSHSAQRSALLERTRENPRLPGVPLPEALHLSAGLDSLDKQLLEFARAYRFTRFKTLRLVCLPALRPQFSAGLLTAFGLAWKSGVAAEVLCPPDRAIGSRIQQAKLGLETADLFAWTLTIVALSLLLEGLLRRGLERRRKM